MQSNNESKHLLLRYRKLKISAEEMIFILEDFPLKFKEQKSISLLDIQKDHQVGGLFTNLLAVGGLTNATLTNKEGILLLRIQRIPQCGYDWEEIETRVLEELTSFTREITQG